MFWGPFYALGLGIKVFEVRQHIRNLPVASQATALFALLVIASLLSAMDYQAFPLLVTPIKSEFRLSDLQVGSLQGFALSLTTGLFALPAGYLTDKTNRVKLFGTGVLVWSAFTALSGFCSNFTELFICRSAVGLAEAVVYPTSISLIADLYDARARTRMVFIYICVMQVLSGLATSFFGFLIGSVMYLSAKVGHQAPMLSVWRSTFVLASLPGLVLAALFFLSKEPRRQEQAEGRNQDASGSVIVFLFRHPFIVGALLLAAPLSWVGANAFYFWMPTILTRQFGFRLDAAGETFGLVVALGTVSGVLLSALLTGILRKRSQLLAILLPFQIGMLAVAFVTLMIFIFHASSTSLLFGSLALQTAAYITVPTVPSIITIITPGRLRGRVLGVSLFVSVCIMTTLPPTVGALSDKVYSGASAALMACLTVAIPTSLLALVFLVGLSRRLRDFTRVEDTGSASMQLAAPVHPS